MLVLTRKSEQKIRIGKDVVITVLKVQGDQVSIGIEAPKSLPIYREEILLAIKEENTGAAASPNLSLEEKQKSISSLSRALRSKKEKTTAKKSS